MRDPDGNPPADFPLGVASNGQYCKKYQQRRHHFGAVSAGWRAALERYAHDWPFILAGKAPPPMPGNGSDPLSLDYIANKFVERELGRFRRGQLSAGSYIEIRNSLEVVLAHVGQRRDARTLLPDDFADLRYALGRKWTRDEATGRWSMNRDRAVGPDLLKRRIIHVRAMFNYARESQLLADVPLYGDEFKIVPIAQLRKARRNRAREHGPKLFPQEQVPLIYGACDVEMRAAFLLSVLCGFNEADCGLLPMRAVDLKNGFIDFDRVKTGVYRRVALPRALKAALKAVLDARRTPADPETIVHEEDGCPPIRVKDLVFLTERGNPWISLTVKEKDGVPDKINHHGGFAKRLDEILEQLDGQHPDGVGGFKFKRKGISFGAGRHTFESNGKRVGDDNIVKFVMGHASGEMDQWYDHPPDEDLRAVASAVYSRLFGPDQPEDAAATTPASLRLVS